MLKGAITVAALLISAPALAAGVQSHGHGIPGVVDGGHPRRVIYADHAPPGHAAYWSTGKRMKGCSYQDRPIRDMSGAPATGHFLNCNVRYLDPPQKNLWKRADEQSGR